MDQKVIVGLAQRLPVPHDQGLQPFAADVTQTLKENPEINVLVFPEMHLHGVLHLEKNKQQDALESAAVSLDSDFVAQIGEIAKKHQIWLCPGSIEERAADGKLYNTQLLFSPAGELVTSYKKMFPWRPDEKEALGTEFVTAEVPDLGVTFGMSNCYDAWFPEHTRNLAWLGSDVILNVVKTTSADREQELTLARANAIVNQVYMLSVNCAEPYGRGRSIAVDPEGFVLAEAGLFETTLVVRVDPKHLENVRETGTAGTNRIWHQFEDGDPEIKLPMYEGRISPAEWTPKKVSALKRPAREA